MRERAERGSGQDGGAVHGGAADPQGARPELTRFHGTALGVAIDEQGPLRGLLLTGPAGSGKSKLAADLIAHCPFRRTGLIGDDLVAVDDGPVLFPPKQGPRLLHLRGLGIAEVQAAPPLPLFAWIALGPAETALPEPLGGLAPIPATADAVTAASIRLVLLSLAKGRSLWCGFEPGPLP